LITSLLRAAALALALAAPAAAEGPLVVGAAVAESGFYADLAAGYRKALLLWQEQVNASGGLLGRPVALRLLDDASEATRVGRLYEQLIRDEKAEALLGPFGTAATKMAAAASERARRVLVHASGASRAVHKSRPRYVFQAGVPYRGFGEGALQIARQAGLRRVFLVARSDPVSREMAERAREEALALELEPSVIEVFRGGAEDFAPQVAKARAAQSDAWIAFAPARDAAEMVKTFRRLGYAPRLFFASGAAEPQFVRLVGQDAESSLGVLAYAPSLPTPGNAGFAKAYTAKWSAAPDLGAALGYACAQVLEQAIRGAGTTDPERLREALATLGAATVLGEYRVDPQTGEQTGMRPPVVQILRGRQRVIWPESLAEARLQPYPAWSERTLLE
jgi:branched-chain amino acid transport system substrate-binding protein